MLLKIIVFVFVGVINLYSETKLHGWNIETRVDPIDDTSIVMFYKKNIYTGYKKSGFYAISFDSAGNIMHSFFNKELYNLDERCIIEYRVNSEKPRITTCNGNGNLFIVDPDGWISEDMEAGAETLTVRIHSGGDSSTMMFDVVNYGKLLKGNKKNWRSLSE